MLGAEESGKESAFDITALTFPTPPPIQGRGKELMSDLGVLLTPVSWASDPQRRNQSPGLMPAASNHPTLFRTPRPLAAHRKEQEADATCFPISGSPKTRAEQQHWGCFSFSLTEILDYDPKSKAEIRP